MNQIVIVGNLTRDAELRKAGDTDVASFTVAENRKVKGEAVTLFFDCSLWGNRGVNIAQYLTKGGQVTVSGELLPPRVKDGKVFLDVRVADVSLPVRREARTDEW